MSMLNSMKPFKLKKVAVIFAGITAFLLAILKLFVGIFGSSVAVMSSAVDSMLDCLVSALNYFALKKSSDSPNARFNYGYGKIEALASLFEGSIIVSIGIFVFYESVRSLFDTEKKLDIFTDITVMMISLVATGILIIFLNKVAKITDSLIIKADALHYKSDFYTNLGIVVSLLIIKLTGFVFIDSIIGICASIYILYSAFFLIKEGIYMLLDGSLDDEIINKIAQIILSKKDITSFHYLKSRKSADVNYLSYHLVFNKEISLFNAHEISDQVVEQIKSEFNDMKWQITSELDPYDDSDGKSYYNNKRCVIEQKDD